MHQLNLELLEQLDVACGWILDKHITIPNSEQIASLLVKAKALLKEIQAEEPRVLQYQKLADEKKQHIRADEDEPVPSKSSKSSVMTGCYDDL